MWTTRKQRTKRKVMPKDVSLIWTLAQKGVKNTVITEIYGFSNATIARIKHAQGDFEVYRNFMISNYKPYQKPVVKDVAIEVVKTPTAEPTNAQLAGMFGEIKQALERIEVKLSEPKKGLFGL